MRRPLHALGSLLLALCGCGTGASGPPHIVMVTSDALRADHLSVYGYARETTPHLDAFARDAWLFEDAVTVIPKTRPAFASILSGRHPVEHRVHHNKLPLPEGLPLLSETLRAAGYRTAAFVSNPSLGSDSGLARGFDVYQVVHSVGGTAGVNEAFLAWAEEPWDRPTFVWIHYIDPHGPYTPPEGYAGLFAGDELDADTTPAPRPSRHSKVLGALPGYQVLADEQRLAGYVRRYDEEIRFVDAAFGEVLDALRERDLYDSSAVLFLSDHGESLGEHDYYFEHGWYAYDAGLRIPLLLKEPGQWRGRRVETQVSVLDVAPTLLALAGLERLEAVLGRDLRQSLEPDRAVLVTSSGGYPVGYVGVRGSGIKYLEDRLAGRPELYRLDEDPGELRSVHAEAPDELRQARERLEALRAQLRPLPRAGRPRRAPDPSTVEELEALGYGDGG